jgi:hypothetical protein
MPLSLYSNNPFTLCAATPAVYYADSLFGRLFSHEPAVIIPGIHRSERPIHIVQLYQRLETGE